MIINSQVIWAKFRQNVLSIYNWTSLQFFAATLMIVSAAVLVTMLPSIIAISILVLGWGVLMVMLAIIILDRK